MAGTVVYALGGGAGHLARASLFAARELADAGPVTILHGEAAPRVVTPPDHVELVAMSGDARPADVRARLLDALGPQGDRDLVVDAFPAGLGREIDDEVLARAARTTLVRRYVKPLAYPDYDALAARFDRWVFPYGAGRCEWDAQATVPARPSRHVGLLVRPLRIAAGAPAPLAVVGDVRLLGAGLRARLPRDTVVAAGPFDALPPARAYLGTNAGYHLTYELDALGLPYGVVPRDRRYDDPFRRADLLGRAILRPGDVDRLVEEAA